MPLAALLARQGAATALADAAWVRDARGAQAGVGSGSRSLSGTPAAA